MRQLGGAFGVAVLVAVFAAAGSYASPEAFVDGFAPAVGACALLGTVAALAGLALPGRRIVGVRQATVVGSGEPVTDRPPGRRAAVSSR